MGIFDLFRKRNSTTTSENNKETTNTMEFNDLLKKRRSIYALGKNTELSQEEIVARLRETAEQVPTAFGIQTSRYIVLFDEANEKLWNLIAEVQKDVLNDEMWAAMSPVIEGSKDALGTVLFFEDRDVVETMPTQDPSQTAYKLSNNANAQYATWLTLADLDLGASLQHFNVGYEQGFDKAIRELFNLPESYELVAQMPFGSVEQAAGDKETMDSKEQVQVFNK